MASIKDMARQFAITFYKSKAWEQARTFALMDANYLCEICGAPAEEVHHIVHLSPDNINDPNISLARKNLMCLCRDCHFKQHRGEHGRGRENQEKYPYEFDENGMLIQKSTPPP